MCYIREVGSTKDVTDQAYIAANDSTPVDLGGGVLEDSVNVPANSFGTFQLIQIPPGIYELTVKAPGYVTGRTDTLDLFKWDGADTQGRAVASGVYFYNLEAGEFSQIRKMMLVK